jgi:hypothetical protein
MGDYIYFRFQFWDNNPGGRPTLAEARRFNPEIIGTDDFGAMVGGKVNKPFPKEYARIVAESLKLRKPIIILLSGQQVENIDRAVTHNLAGDEAYPYHPLHIVADY